MLETTLLPLHSLPLGFRFHPTDEELINHYLKLKITGRDSPLIPEVDVCKCEPWDLPDKSVIRSSDPEWFFFAGVDRKYPTGHRSNRATEAGYWKATGKDRLIKGKAPGKLLIGMKKTLVFYRGRAPKGKRTCWIMHEYRTVEPEFEYGEQGGFVLCRLFRKPEENIPSSNADEMERSGFSPTPTRSSRGDTLHGADALEECTTPLNNTVESKLQEDLQPMFDAADKQPTGFESWPGDKTDCSIAYPLKQEESHCNSNLTSDVGDHEGVVSKEVDPLLDDLAQFLGLESEQLDSKDHLHVDSPRLPVNNVYTDIEGSSHTGGFQYATPEQDSIDEFLNSVFCDPEDSIEVSNFDKDSTAEVFQEGECHVMKEGSFWDSVSGMDTGISSDMHAEALLTNGGLGLEASGQFFRPPFPSYSSSQMYPSNSQMYPSNSYHVIEPQFNDFYETECARWVSPLPSVESATELSNSKEKSNSGLESIVARSLPVISANADAQDNFVATGIKIRTRHPQKLANSSNFMTQQGGAMRRIRLQSCKHLGSELSKGEKLGVSNDKQDAEITKDKESGSRNDKQDANTKAGQQAKHQIVEATEVSGLTHLDEYNGFLSDHEDTALTEEKPSLPDVCQETAHQAKDTNVKLDGSLHQLTPRTGSLSISRITVVGSVVVLALCVGLGYLLSREYV